MSERCLRKLWTSCGNFVLCESELCVRKVSGVFGFVCFLCGVFVVLRAAGGLWWLLLSLPLLLCSSLLLVWG